MDMLPREAEGMDEPVRALCFIAAEEREFRGFLRRLPRLSRQSWPVEFAAKGEWDGAEVILAANGPGPALARGAVEAALAGSAGAKVGAVVSTGYCGALDAGLAPGDILVIGEVNGLAARAPQTFREFQKGSLASKDRVIVTAMEKLELRRSGAIACDMEASAVAEAAAAGDLPFYCVRVVTDTANEDLPLDFNRYRDERGRFDRLRIAGGALSHPFSVLPALLRFDGVCSRASDTLGDFLADCRF